MNRAKLLRLLSHTTGMATTTVAERSHGLLARRHGSTAYRWCKAGCVAFVLAMDTAPGARLSVLAQRDSRAAEARAPGDQGAPQRRATDAAGGAGGQDEGGEVVAYPAASK